MGHTRLGELPKTRSWSQIVRLIGTAKEPDSELGRSDIAKIASRTVTAARAGLEKAIDDPGLHQSFYLLTQIAQAGKAQDWSRALSQSGIDAKHIDNIFELSGRLQDVLDRRIGGSTTDLSEVAQKAAGEALLSASRSHTPSLFGSSSDEVGAVLRSVSTKNGFAELGHKFFGKFIARFLNSYLSRATASQLGRGSLRQVGDISQFNEALEHHCDQTARIVRDFCGDWYSKTAFAEGFTEENTRRFIAVALKKVRAELKRQKVDE